MPRVTQQTYGQPDSDALGPAEPWARGQSASGQCTLLTGRPQNPAPSMVCARSRQQLHPWPGREHGGLCAWVSLAGRLGSDVSAEAQTSLWSPRLDQA